MWMHSRNMDLQFMSCNYFVACEWILCDSNCSRTQTILRVYLGFVSQAEMFLLPPVKVQDKNKKCVVIDLDETLVHSSFTVNCFKVYCIQTLPFFVLAIYFWIFWWKACDLVTHGCKMMVHWSLCVFFWTTLEMTHDTSHVCHCMKVGSVTCQSHVIYLSHYMPCHITVYVSSN